MATLESTAQAEVKMALPPAAPYVRVDTLAIKQQLHDVLGSRGLPYWEALREFLTGKLSRQELEDLVMSLAGVVDKQFVPLHNHFLMSILSNAANSSTTPAPGPSNVKRNRPDDLTPYGAKRRVLSWVLGTNRREREKLKMRDAAEETAEKNMKDVERRRDDRRKTGSGWIGGSELTRERAVLGHSSSAGANVADDAKPILPTPTLASQSAPLALATESRFLPSAEDLRVRVTRTSMESGLDGVSPGVGQFLNAALEDHLKNLITSHLRLHRSNLLNVASSSSSSSAALPAFLSAPASPTSTASTLPPLTPPATFSQSAFENLLTIAPATILPHGRISRLVSEGVMDEEGFQQLWEEAAAERRKVTGVDERWSSANKSAAADEPAEDADEDGKAKGKGRSYQYEYVDPKSILDSTS